LKTKKWLIEAKPIWHNFGGKINWFGPKERARMDLENEGAS
jgi:hypothetical protein